MKNKFLRRLATCVNKCQDMATNRNAYGNYQLKEDKTRKKF